MKYFALFALTFFIGLHSQPAIVDDGYIYLTVARNIVMGEGWRFNPNSVAANPCTSPLYVLLLVLLQLLGATPQLSLIFLSSVGISAASAGLLHLYKSRSQLLASVLSFFYLIHPMFLRSLGLETSLFISAIIWTALWEERSCYGCAVACACASALLRIDGLIMLGIVLVKCSSRLKSHIFFRLVCLAALPFLLWVVFSLAYFGQIAPQSVVIKAIQSKYGFWQREGPWIRSLIAAPLYPFFTWAAAIVSFIFSWKASPSPLRSLFLFCIFQIAIYASFNAPPGYPWYFAPACLLVDLLLSEGFLRIHSMYRGMCGKLAANKYWEVLISGYFATIFFVSLSSGGVLSLFFPAPYRLANDYIEAAEWINKNSPHRSPSVAATEIGYLGFALSGSIIDICGLIHPNATTPLKRGELSWWYAKPYPDYIVLHLPFPWDGEPSESWPSSTFEDFLERYVELYVTETKMVKVYGLRETKSLSVRR